MSSFFARFRSRDGKKVKKGNADDLAGQQTAKRWEDASLRTSVEPEEIQELIKRCTEELKSRGTFGLPPMAPSPRFVPYPALSALVAPQLTPCFVCRSPEPPFPALALPTCIRPERRPDGAPPLLRFAPDHAG